jgi:hypothetical protein
VDSAILGGLFAPGGVVLGAGLNELSARMGRRELLAEQREHARHERELAAAEFLDAALVRVSEAVDRHVNGETLGDRYSAARDAWQEGWVAYSPRLRQPELLDRFQAVGSLLTEATLNAHGETEVPRHYIARSVANARSSLAHFMRGDPLPPTAFPSSAELVALLGQGDGTADRFAPLRGWLDGHAMPEFHPLELGKTPARRRLRRGT